MGPKEAAVRALRNGRSLYEIYQKSPEACLIQFVTEGLARGGMGRFFIDSTVVDRKGTRYGGSRYYTLEDLNTRTYEIEFWDGAPSIMWTDVYHEPRINKNVPRSEYGPVQQSQ